MRPGTGLLLFGWKIGLMTTFSLCQDRFALRISRQLGGLLQITNALPAVSPAPSGNNLNHTVMGHIEGQ